MMCENMKHQVMMVKVTWGWGPEREKNGQLRQYHSWKMGPNPNNQRLTPN